MSSQFADGGIPLLTEILPGDEDDADDVANAQDLLAPPVLMLDFDIPELNDRHPFAVGPAVAPATPAEPHLSEQDMERMQAEISERITRQVLSRIDFVLEQRVRDSLADVLQVAVSGLAREIRSGLQQTLEEVIGRAVAQEISRLQTTKNQATSFD